MVTDHPARWADAAINLVVTAGSPARAAVRAQTERATEWLMLTSGTSGVPKIVRHTLEGLTGAIIADGPARGAPPVWATFYDIRRYGGLQIFLRAVIGGGSMVLSEPGEPIADYVARLHATRRHAYIGHAVALAQASDERSGLGILIPVTFACRARLPTRRCWMACVGPFPRPRSVMPTLRPKQASALR